MNRKIFSALLAILAMWNTHFQFTEASSLGLSTTSNLLKGMELAQQLKLGDPCSWEAEEFRQNFTREEILGPKLLEALATMEFYDSLVKQNYSLCSADALYICDKESLKCVCGDPGYESLNGLNRSLYTLEDNKCRWKLDTYCVSDGELNQLQFGVTFDSKCSLGSSCRTREGEICSINAMADYALHGGMSTYLTPRSLAVEVFAGKVCTCKEGQDGGSGGGKLDNFKNDTMKQ